jgi:hypothetical protein
MVTFKRSSEQGDTVKLIEKVVIGAVFGLLFVVMPLLGTIGLAMWVWRDYGPPYAILPVGLLVILYITTWRDLRRHW